MFDVSTKEQALEIIQRMRELLRKESKEVGFSGEEEMWVGRSICLIGGQEESIGQTNDILEVNEILLGDVRNLKKHADSNGKLYSYLSNLPGFFENIGVAENQHLKTLDFLYPCFVKAWRETLHKTTN